jgi:hypothetical protein
MEHGAHKVNMYGPTDETLRQTILKLRQPPKDQP